VSDDHRPAVDPPPPAPFDGGCPVRWLVDDVGRYLAGDDADSTEVTAAGRQALAQAATEVDDVLLSAYRAHEVVAAELRISSPARGFRRTVFALTPSPVALLLLCLRVCEPGDDVAVLQHTAGHGSPSRSAVWPFGLDVAEHLTRPPLRCPGDLPADIDQADG
jgi:hypothetical protein